MIEPKLFYRNFDDLLKKIEQDTRGKNFLRSILNEIHKNFQETLHIGSLRLYEDKGDNFELTEVIGTQRNPVAKKNIIGRRSCAKSAQTRKFHL